MPHPTTASTCGWCAIFPAGLSFGDVNNFNRERMAKLSRRAIKGNDVSLVKQLSPPDRIFNLVGTNANDYSVLGRDVRLGGRRGQRRSGAHRERHHPRASTPTGNDVGSPRAFVHRSHSGHYGIVNSEEGYQNLTRFLFGALRMDGVLDIDDITLPRRSAEVVRRKGKSDQGVLPVRGGCQCPRLPVADDAPRGA
jgi:hypothetical protein